MNSRLLYLLAIPLLSLANPSALAQKELCGNQASTTVLPCTGPSCFGQYSPHTPLGDPALLFEGSLNQCCAQQVLIFEQTNLTCRAVIRKLETHQKFISSLQDSGVHLLIRKCSGGLAPLEQLNPLDERTSDAPLPITPVSFHSLTLARLK